jgi:type IV pilus assembly protein PilC
MLERYAWWGADLDGRSRYGLTAAHDPDHLRRQLSQRGIIPDRSVRLPAGLARVLGDRQPRLRPREVSEFLRQLATLVAAGVPLIEAMAMIAREGRPPALRRLASTLGDEIGAGTPLSVAFASQPAVFDTLICGLVRAGEQSGQLEHLLVRIADDRERAQAIRQRLRRAMFYPLIVLLIALGVSTALLMFVVPRFEALFAGFGAELPAFTRTVIALSAWIRGDGGVLLALTGVALLTAPVLLRRYPRLTQLRDRLALSLPITGTLIERTETARFSRTLAILLQAGAPLAEALPTVAGTLSTRPYQQAILQITDDLRDGRSLAFAVERTRRFPPSTAQMIAIGETAGRLPDVLDRIAARREKEVSQGIDGLGTALEPLLMSVLGLLIGALVLALYLPVFQLGSVL